MDGFPFGLCRVTKINQLTAPGPCGLIEPMYARKQTKAIAAHREAGGRSLRALHLTGGLLLAGSLLALLLRMGAGAG